MGCTLMWVQPISFFFFDDRVFPEGIVGFDEAQVKVIC